MVNRSRSEECQPLWKAVASQDSHLLYLRLTGPGQRQGIRLRLANGLYRLPSTCLPRGTREQLQRSIIFGPRWEGGGISTEAWRFTLGRLRHQEQAPSLR